MTLNNSSDLKRRWLASAVSRGALCLWALAACLWAAQPAAAQTVYSDSWTAGAAGDAETGFSDVPHAYINGVGVTEDNYTSYNQYEVETYISSPTGETAYAYNYGSSYWSRAEAALPVDLETVAEGDYVVESRHYYSQYDNTCISCPAQPVSFKPGATGSAATAIARRGLLGWITRVLASVQKYRQTFAQQGRCSDGRFQYLSICPSFLCAVPQYKCQTYYLGIYMTCSGFKLRVAGFWFCSPGWCSGSNTYVNCK